VHDKMIHISTGNVTIVPKDVVRRSEWKYITLKLLINGAVYSAQKPEAHLYF